MMRLVSIAALVLFSACVKSEEIARCRELAGERASTETIEIRVGSTVRGQEVEAGQVASCQDVEAARVLIRLDRAMSAVAESLRPARWVAHLAPRVADGPPVTSVETHVATGSLLVARSASAIDDPTVWLHELAHARVSRGGRPDEEAAARVLAAIEEALADDLAATTVERTELGRLDGEDLPARDIARAPAAQVGDWAAIGADGWDPHRLGGSLAGRLYSEEPRPGPLLEDLVAVLASREAWEARGVQAALDAVVERCPARSRDRLRAILRAWAPPELGPRRGSTTTTVPATAGP